MLSRALQNVAKKPASLFNVSKRTAYTKETQPYVFINEHTKVLVQGMTGKHVSEREDGFCDGFDSLGYFPHQTSH